MVKRRKKTKRKAKRRKPAFGSYRIRPDAHLAKIIGKGAVTPAQMTKKVWAYIKKKKLARK
jgi:chromatin remodeling complex protein RSC6